MHFWWFSSLLHPEIKAVFFMACATIITVKDKQSFQRCNTKVHFIYFFPSQTLKVPSCGFSWCRTLSVEGGASFFLILTNRYNIVLLFYSILPTLSHVWREKCVCVFIIINNNNMWLLYLKQSGHLVFCNC